VKHRSEAVHIPYDEHARLTFYHAFARKPVKLAGYGLAMGADTTCNFGMLGRRDNPRALALAWRCFRQPQKLGLNPIVYGEGTEFVHAIRE